MDILSKVKGAILSKEEAKTVKGGYTNGSFSGDCSFICCGGTKNQGASVTSCGKSLYVYKPNPSLYCVTYC